MFDFFRRKPLEEKASVSEAQIINAGQHQWSMTDGKKYATEGYGFNPTVYSCIYKTATNAASVIPFVRVNGERVKDHPLEQLLRKPNPDEGGQEFRTASYSWLLLNGNCFQERIIGVGGLVSQLWNWQPYDMSIATSKADPRMPAQYSFARNTGYSKNWDVDIINGESDMLHWRTFNPSPEANLFGQAPLAAAASSADQLNAGNKWRYNSYKNDMAPPGVIYNEKGLTGPQRKEVEDDLNKKKSGLRNARKYLLLGGLKWQSMGVNAKDADWLEGSKFNKQEIAEVYGVPTQLLGIEGSQTYANYEEARAAFWIETVLPLVDLYFSELNRWLAPLYGDNVEIYYDEDSLTAFEPIRRERRQQKIQSGAYTKNEIREMFGDEPLDVPEMDEVFIQSSEIPIGLDASFTTTEERDAAQAAKGLERIGFSREEAQQKAFELFHMTKGSPYGDS